MNLEELLSSVAVIIQFFQRRTNYSVDIFLKSSEEMID
jgi:hypothetical protein